MCVDFESGVYVEALETCEGVYLNVYIFRCTEGCMLNFYSCVNMMRVCILEAVEP